MSENKMKEVAQLLGVEIGEEFKIEKEGKYKFTEDRYKFTNECLMVLLTDGKWCTAPLVLYKLLNGRYKLIKIPKPVLDDVEKEYLSYVIKPFRNRIKYFHKYPCGNGEYEAIDAIMEAYSYCDYLAFPKFKKGFMYKGMELMKEYTLEELGL